MSRLMLQWCCCLLALVACRIDAASPPTVTELQQAGRLEVASTILPADNIVPRQKLRLVLEIATDRWFTGGTRIVVPEVPGLVILQTEQFASNASENRRGQSWVVQRWSLDVYPRRDGEFTIPPVRLRLQVNAGEAGDIEGELTSPPVRFRAQAPVDLQQTGQWVAAPAFSVSQRFDRELADLTVGDAFSRDIVFEASDVMAMMLPDFEVDETTGLAVYPAPPQLEDSSNRGETQARRSQRISYVAEAEGRYILPGGEFAWWDTGTNRLQWLSLPDTEIFVGLGGVADTGTELVLPRMTREQRLKLLGGLILFSGALWLAWWLLPRLPLARFRRELLRVWRLLADLRKPALPARLNPGSTAGE